MERPLPRRHGGQLGTIRINAFPVELAPADINVDVARAQPPFALPREADQPEEDYDGEGEVRLEEARGVVVAASWRADGDVELCDSAQGQLMYGTFREVLSNRTDGTKRQELYGAMGVSHT